MRARSVVDQIGSKLEGVKNLIATHDDRSVFAPENEFFVAIWNLEFEADNFTLVVLNPDEATPPDSFICWFSEDFPGKFFNPLSWIRYYSRTRKSTIELERVLEKLIGLKSRYVKQTKTT